MDNGHHDEQPAARLLKVDLQKQKKLKTTFHCNKMNGKFSLWKLFRKFQSKVFKKLISLSSSDNG
jgi:hypothetical protein